MSLDGVPGAIFPRSVARPDPFAADQENKKDPPSTGIKTPLSHVLVRIDACRRFCLRVAGVGGTRIAMDCSQFATATRSIEENIVETISIRTAELEYPGLQAEVKGWYEQGAMILGEYVGRLRAFWFRSATACWLYASVIASVAIYDIFLTIKYASSLPQMEVNPVGRWLMNLKDAPMYYLDQPPDVLPFLILKGLGTCVVVATIHALVRWKGDMGHAVGFGVSVFQVGLAGYLTFR